MTISAVVPDIAFAGSSGSGTLGPFSLSKSGSPIVFYNNSEVIVFRYDTTTDTAPVLLVEGTDYDLTGGPTAGSITLTSPQTGLLTDERLYVFTKISIAQALDLVNGGNFSAANLERRLDIMTGIMQQLDREIKSTIRFAMFDTDEIPKTTPLAAVIDKIPYVTGTAANPLVAFLDAAALGDLVELTDEDKANLSLVAADLGGADTIGQVAAVSSEIETIGPVAGNIVTVAGAINDGTIGDLLDGQVGKVTDYAALKVVDAEAGKVVYLAGRLTGGDGGQGFFRWVAGNQSANVTNDPAEGVWVAPTLGPTGASGAWRRIQQNNNEVQALWFVASDSNAGRLAAGEAAVDYLADSQANGVVHLPPSWVISGEWVISRPDITLKGSGEHTTFVLSTDTDAPCITFAPTTAGVSSGYLDDCAIENVACGYSAGAIGIAGSVGLWVRMCQRFSARGLRPVNGQIGLRISGGQLNTFERFIHIGAPGSTGVKIESEAIGGGLFQTAFTIQFDGLILSGSEASRAFDIASSDGLSIDNGYIAFHDDAHIRLLKERTDSIGQIFVSNIYFDGVDSQLVGGISPAHILEAPAHAFGNSGVYIHFTNCTFANCTGDLWSIESGIVGLRIANCTFVNSTGWAMSATLASGDITLIGNKFRNTGTAGVSGGLAFAGTIGNLTICNNAFEFIEYRQIQLAGTITSFICVGNDFTGTIADITGSATIGTQVVLNASGSSSPYGNKIPATTDVGTLRTNPLFSSVLTANTQSGVVASPITLQASRDANVCGFFRRTSSDGSLFAFYRDTTNVGSISVTTTATAFNTSSDYRLKDNIDYLDAEQARAFIGSLKPRRYDWRATGQESWGFIAHEYAEQSPSAVTGEKDGEDMQAVSYSDPKLIAAMVREIQTLREEIETLKAS